MGNYSKVVDKRAIKVAEYMIMAQCTIRQAAKVFGVSKSTVHQYIRERRYLFDPSQQKALDRLLAYNFSQRHVRGGEGTRRHWGY